MVDYLRECLKEPVPREWSFPESEYRARLEKTRQAMDEAGIDVLLVHAIVDNCYLSGYQSLWPEAYACLVVPRDSEPFMQVGEIEGALAVLQGYVKDIVTFSWVGADVAPTQLGTAPGRSRLRQPEHRGPAWQHRDGPPWPPRRPGLPAP